MGYKISKLGIVSNKAIIQVYTQNGQTTVVCPFCAFTMYNLP
jgi:hypothetical protein